MMVFATFGFEGAHYLPAVPPGHKCGRMHGHNWTVEIYVDGEPAADTGWIIDYYKIEEAWRRLVYDVLDHRTLNDIAGLNNPTTERIAAWIVGELRPVIAGLSKVVVRETPSFGAVATVANR